MSIVNNEAELAELKRLNPHVPEEHIQEAIKCFDEQLDYINTTVIPEFNRVIDNALKVAVNSKWPPEPFLAMLAEKILKFSVRNSSDVSQTLLKIILDQRNDNVKNLKRQ